MHYRFHSNCSNCLERNTTPDVFAQNMPKKNCVAVCRNDCVLETIPAISINQVCQEVVGGVGGGLTHTLNVDLPLHAVCTRVQVNFRNGTHPPLPSPTSSCNVKGYQTSTNIFNSSSSWVVAPGPPAGLRMKILTSIQKQNSHHRLVFLWRRGDERGWCFDRSDANHAGIHRERGGVKGEDILSHEMYPPLVCLLVCQRPLAKELMVN